MVGCRIQKKLRFEKDLIVIYNCKIVAFIFIDINLKKIISLLVLKRLIKFRNLIRYMKNWW